MAANLSRDMVSKVIGSSINEAVLLEHLSFHGVAVVKHKGSLNMDLPRERISEPFVSSESIPRLFQSRVGVCPRLDFEILLRNTMNCVEIGEKVLN